MSEDGKSEVKDFGKHIELLKDLETRLTGIPNCDMPDIEIQRHGKVKLGAWLWRRKHAADDEENNRVNRVDLEERFAAYVTAFPEVEWKKNDPTASGFDGNYYRLQGSSDEWELDLIASRADVCERVVVMEHEVIEEVPDPEQVAKIPLVKRPRMEQIIEWQCNKAIADITSPVKAPVTV